MSQAEEEFLFQVKAYGLPRPEREYRFSPLRRWRFDFAWVDKKIAAEIEGGVWNGGRHTTGTGFTKDCEKYNTALLQGWSVLRFPSCTVKSGTAIQMVQSLFGR